MSITVIDIYGQFFDKGCDHHYVYRKLQTNSWQRYIREFRFTGRSSVYSTWCSDEGCWIAIHGRNPLSDRSNDTFQISFCLGKNRPKDGEKLKLFLDEAKKFFIDRYISQYNESRGFSWNDSETEEWLAKNEIDLLPTQCEASNPDSTIGYRVFHSEEELSRFFTFLPQTVHEKYGRVFFFSESFNEFGNAEKIVVPVNRIFKIDCSQVYCSIDKEYAEEGSSVTLTFNKPQWHQQKKNVEVSKNSKDGSIQADEVFKINDIKFQLEKFIVIQCVDENDNPINTDVRISINSKKIENCNNDDKGNYPICVPDNLCAHSVKIRISHPNYQDVEECNIPIEENKTYSFKLKSKGFRVEFQLGKKTYSSTALVPEGSKDFNELKRQGAIISGQKLIVSFSKSGRSPFFYYLKIILNIICYLAALLYVCSCILGNPKPFPFNQKIEELEEPIVVVSDTIVTKYDESPSVDLENADIVYMKKNNVWVVDSLKSAKYKNLCALIERGEVDSILAHDDWFPQDTKKTNGFWSQGYNGLRNNKGQLAINDIKNELKKVCADKGNINVEQFATSFTYKRGNKEGASKTKVSKSGTKDTGTMTSGF